MKFDRRLFLGTAALASFGRGTMRAAQPESAAERTYELLLKEYLGRQQSFTRAVEKLAAECETKGYPADAGEMRVLAEPLDDQSLLVDELPENERAEISRNYPPDQRSCLTRMRQLREDYANELFQLSVRARQKRQISMAWRLVREAAFFNTDHERARALLGYVKYDTLWMTPFRRQMLKAGNVWNERFGWLPEGDVKRYEAGERNFNGRWISADLEASKRSDFRFAWEARSEHFLVRTNFSLERAVEISTQLERFHDYFVHAFSAVFMTPQQLQQLFEGGGGGTPRISQPHIVHYYRNQQEFVQALEKKQPEAAFSNGIYLPHLPDRRSYFFHRPGAEDELEDTLYHETTHQILSESLRRPVEVGAQANFWLVEGLACYLESFRPGKRGGSVGNPRHPRIQWARQYLGDGAYVPMAPFTGMSQREFQCMDMPKDESRFRRLQQFYAQSAGVAHFFLHFGEGQYREALVSHLADIYSPDQRVRERAPGLDERTGVPFAELDRQYADYLAKLA